MFELMTVTELTICCIIVTGAAILQVAAGMGFGMLAAPLIALFNPQIVPGSVLLMGLFVATAGAWRERKNIVPVELKLGVLGRVIGSAGALAILFFLPDRQTFMVIFGILILCAVAMTAFGRQISFSMNSLFGLSVVSGLMGSLTAVGAPPMALIYHHREPEIVRPTLNAFFGAGSVLGLASLSISGWLSWHDFAAAIILMPAMLLGIWIAGYLRRISSRTLSTVLLSLSAIAAILLIIRGIW